MITRGDLQQRVGRFELKPPVSTSTTTGRKPRKRWAIVGEALESVMRLGQAS
jgi:hypothetical protein